MSGGLDEKAKPDVLVRALNLVFDWHKLMMSGRLCGFPSTVSRERMRRSKLLRCIPGRFLLKLAFVLSIKVVCSKKKSFGRT